LKAFKRSLGRMNNGVAEELEPAKTGTANLHIRRAIGRPAISIAHRLHTKPLKAA